MSDDGDGRSHLQQKPEHKFILTMRGNRLFRVRCKCMAEYRGTSDRYYNYDHLADVDSPDKARSIYNNHVLAARLLEAVNDWYDRNGVARSAPVG